eukprot:TRINITY_DN0_c3630_g1_i4.p1 TRINITY_DN0_c3630_g1~~TRINITY_DN0_c3630_g1_i4.p1  ORF type:complete len:191 (-),score=49.76 TRINITY_DN0_c3630_g1_i4:92-664(-)
MIVPSQDQRVAKKYYDTLPAHDVNRNYAEKGEKYVPVKFGIINYLKSYLNGLTPAKKLDYLSKFYPYQKTVVAEHLEYYGDYQDKLVSGLIFSSIASLLLFNLARRGYVIPIFREYGLRFKTHRLFRQYLYVWLLPQIWAWDSTDFKHFTMIESLWAVHANRLNQNVFSDPNFTYHPPSENPNFVRKVYY